MMSTTFGGRFRVDEGMSRYHRFRGRYGVEPNPTRCAASIPEPRVGFHQCPNNPKPGTEWCGIHTEEEIPENPDLLWIVYEGDLASVPIRKETKKQVVIESLGAFEWKMKIHKNTDGKLEIGFRTRLEAVQHFLKSVEKSLTNARHAVVKAELKKHQAEQLLAKEEGERCGYCDVTGVEMEEGDSVIQGQPRCVDAEACDKRTKAPRMK